LWEPPHGAAYSLDGFDVQRRPAFQVAPAEVCHSISSAELVTLRRRFELDTALARVGLQRVPSPATRLWRETTCWAHRIVATDGRELTSVTASGAAMLVIAMSQGKALGTWARALPGGEVRVGARRVDELRVYSNVQLATLRFCTATRDPIAEAAEWRDVPYLVRGVQLPVAALDPSLAGAAAEEGRATERLVTGEDFDRAGFAQLTSTLSASLLASPDLGIRECTTLGRASLEVEHAELPVRSLLVASRTSAVWRRILGFGYLDRGRALTPGAAYDYRISGRFHRRHLEATYAGFHTVPTGTTLPRLFHLGSIACRTRAPGRIVLADPSPDAALRHTSRRGFPLGDAAPAGSWIDLAFTEPVRRIELELDPRIGTSLALRGRREPGAGPSTYELVQPVRDRVRIEWPEPVHLVRVSGECLLHGIRIPSSAADDVVTRSAVLSQIRYVSTPPPSPPRSVTATNLQQRAAPAASSATPTPPQGLGFRVAWAPPTIAGTDAPDAWPPDLAAAVPTDVAGYALERLDPGATAFAPVGGDTVYHGSRSGARIARPIRLGDDLLELFPEAAPPTPPVPLEATFEDVVSASGEARPGPGGTYEYRVFSIDALGRRSSTATRSGPIQLEKHRPPPMPIGPEPDGPPGPASPSGIRAYVLQQGDAMTDADRARLGSARNAIVIRWDWRAEYEAKLDPFATEFRVYFQPAPPDLVSARTIGAIAFDGTRYTMTVQVGGTIAADAARGTYITAGELPFLVVGHTGGDAGDTIVLQLERNAVHPDRRPEPGELQLAPALDGSERRPLAWSERVAQLPITAREHVLPDRLVLDADHPRARIWIGVSAADDQRYVVDELPATRPLGGRRGNESRIAIGAATARYRGRPSFAPPEPLRDVPEVVVAEPVADDVACVLDLPAITAGLALPAGQRVRIERLSLARLGTALRVTPSGDLAIVLPDGSTHPYRLAHPGDHAAFVAQLKSGNPARVENRFLVDLAIRYDAAAASLPPDHAPELWEPTTLLAVAASGPAEDRLPRAPGRFAHRIRLVDAAGHFSDRGAVLPQVVRVPSLRAPAPPMVAASADGERVTARISYRSAFDLSWCVVFTRVAASADRAGAAETQRPQLLRIPNLRGRYPRDGIRLRLDDGTLLAPAEILTVASEPSDGVARELTAEVTLGYERRAVMWAALVTRDGVPSSLAGPATATTGPAPPRAPEPALDPSAPAASPDDHLTWTAVADSRLELAVEQRLDAASAWTRVTPWLPAHVVRVAVPGAAGPRWYRLVVRDASRRIATSGELRIG
jgi:hypothetical protein